MQLINRLINKIDHPIIKVGNKQKSQLTTQEIPTIVFQTWTDSLFGIRHAKEINKFRNLNPELDFVIYNDQDCDKYMNEAWSGSEILEIYKKSLFGPLKADIFRYCILFDKGGYYFDISKGCRFPLTKLHKPNNTAIISAEKNECFVPPDFESISKLIYYDRYYLQWGFGFKKNHIILETTINNICKYYPFFKGKIFKNPKSAILAFTGPGMFTKSLRESIPQLDIDDIKQAGVDFNDYGVFSLTGSEVRYKKIKPYTDFSNSMIVQ